LTEKCIKDDGDEQLIKGINLETNKKCIIKIVNKNNLIYNKNKTFKEIEILKKIESDCIVKYLDHFEDKKTIYIVFDYYKIFTATQVNEKDFLRYSLNLSEGVRLLHSYGFIHNNINPLNIGLAYNKCKLSNLENVIIISQPNFVFSNSIYTAPEIFAGMAHYASDIWSIGISLYYVITGKLPFEAAVDIKCHINFICSFNPSHLVTNLNIIKSDKLKMSMIRCLIVDYKNRIDIEEFIRNVREIYETYI
jgi:serine/threonine protein kinase